MRDGFSICLSRTVFSPSMIWPHLKSRRRLAGLNNNRVHSQFPSVPPYNFLIRPIKILSLSITWPTASLLYRDQGELVELILALKSISEIFIFNNKSFTISARNFHLNWVTQSCLFLVKNYSHILRKWIYPAARDFQQDKNVIEMGKRRVFI